jgi:predicted O-linked N-acetylglucosamine transferase (SPINDLY family)
MSSDLRNHPVCYFAWPILEEYDRSKFEIYCYSFSTKPADGAQTKIETMVDCFRLKPNISDEDAALMIAADSLDILFELGGTTDMNKLEVMALRPAPIQVSWVGYPHSSGLETIDYILTDPYITPKDPRLLIEKPFELKESWVALGRLGFHDVEILPSLPEDRDGFFTFGTASNPYKFTPDLLATWAAIMREVPDSRFLFIRPEGGTLAFRENMLAHFAKHGLAPERIMFEAVRGKHMQHYNRVDIALDTFPHVGGTTTCETLWMGVPTVSVAGPAFFERMSYSNLSNAGLGDLCGHSVEEYIQIALKLAADKPRRAHLRQHLRQEMKTRPLGDTTRFVRNFEAKVTEVVKGNML